MMHDTCIHIYFDILIDNFYHLSLFSFANLVFAYLLIYLMWVFESIGTKNKVR